MDMCICVKIAETAIILIFSVFSDIKYSKILNKITLPGILTGLLTNFLFEGTKGAADSISGAALPVLLLFALFALRLLGAGDVKLFAAVGSVMGAGLVLRCMAYSMLSGGVIAVLFIAARKNAVERFKYLFTYLRLCFLTLKVCPYQDFEKKGSGLFRFSYAAASGTLIALLADYVR